MTDVPPTLTGLVVADAPTAWADAGFAVVGDHLDVAGVRLTLTGDSEGRGVVAWSLSDVADDAIDGLATVHAPGGVPVGRPPGHPNGTIAIDHLVVASPAPARTAAALAGHGIEPRRTRDTEVAGNPLRQVFFRLGEPILELIGPPDGEGDGPASFWGLAFTVDDLDAAKDLLGDGLSDPKHAVQPGRCIATLRHRDVGIGVPVAFMSR